MPTAVTARWEWCWSAAIPAHTLGTCCNAGDSSHVTGSNRKIIQSILCHFTTWCHLEYGTDRASPKKQSTVNVEVAKGNENVK